MSVPSLLPYLHRSLRLDMRMRAADMHPDDRRACRWVGFGISKGVTNPERDCTLLALPHELTPGVHAELIRGFPGVDPLPLCYDMEHHVRGFGGFVRWAFFADPDGGPGVLGVDWSLHARPTAGVAYGMHRIAQVATVILRHGIPGVAGLALLNWRMCEDAALAAWREAQRLRTVADWASRGSSRFTRRSAYCPRCGLRTFALPAHFCQRCGCDPRRYWIPTEVLHGLEERRLLECV